MQLKDIAVFIINNNTDISNYNNSTFNESLIQDTESIQFGEKNAKKLKQLERKLQRLKEQEIDKQLSDNSGDPCHCLIY
jgi:hypothetical protein